MTFQLSEGYKSVNLRAFTNDGGFITGANILLLDSIITLSGSVNALTFFDRDGMGKVKEEKKFKFQLRPIFNKQYLISLVGTDGRLFGAPNVLKINDRKEFELVAFVNAELGLDLDNEYERRIMPE